MKISERFGSVGWAFAAMVLVVLAVVSLAGVSPKPMRAAGNPASLRGMAPASEITPGPARAEFDTLDMQLD
jgi:hypothetical protein